MFVFRKNFFRIKNYFDASLQEKRSSINGIDMSFVYRIAKRKIYVYRACFMRRKYDINEIGFKKANVYVGKQLRDYIDFSIEVSNREKIV